MPALSIAINTFRHGGGMESYTFDLVRALAAEGENIRVYAAKFDTALPEYALVEACRINQDFVPKKLRPFFFTKQLARRRRPSEKLIACNPSDDADVFCCGGTHLGYLNALKQGKAAMADRLTIARNRSNYATAKTVMAHSDLMRRELTGLYGVPPEKIRVVYPPADTSRFSPAAGAEAAAVLRRKYGFADHETVFLFPSTGHTRKGFEMLAAFFSQTGLPVKMAVAGSPLPHPVRNVIQLGFCTDMPGLYRAADYTVMASLYEPFGLVGVESVLCGTRVVMSDNMGCTEVMNGGAGFFFSRSRPESLEAAVGEAVALRETGGHKIAEPLKALTYDPAVSVHIKALREMLDAV